MADEDDELSGLFAAWREDIDSVPQPAMLVLELAVMLQVLSPASSPIRLRPGGRFALKRLRRPPTIGCGCRSSARPVGRFR